MIRERDGRLHISGPITFKNAMMLREQSEQYFDRPQLLFDFSEVREIDSAAVSLMLEWSRKARAAGRDLQFANLGKSIVSLMDLYGVEDLIPVATALQQTKPAQ
jgi:phospholipid transport system transporter-binding protein